MLNQVMERRRLLAAMVFAFLLVACAGRQLGIKYEDQISFYNSTLAKILVEYTAAVYTADLTSLFTWTCSRCTDMTAGFEVVEVIVDVQNCLQAYVGVAEDLNSVIIVFRGTQEHSIQNWIEDLYWKQLDLNYPDMPDAMVHHGFYHAYHNTSMRPGILLGLQETRELFGDMQITVVGHSMGGAMAAFCALDLKVWLHEIGLESLVYPVETICDETGEDPSCCRSVRGNSISDHLVYLGVSLHAETWRSCGIVTGTNMMKNYQTDLSGNFVISRDSATSVKQQSTELEASSSW